LTNKPQINEGHHDLFEAEGTVGNTKQFVQALHQKALNPALFWSSHFKLTKYKKLIDIGGGSGIHAIAAGLHNPLLKGTICDRYPVLKYAKLYVKSFKLTTRITTKNFDMWKDLLPQGDVYFLGDILHDWPYEKCLFLLKKCYKQLPKDGIILIHEMLFNNNKTGPFLTSAYNIKMTMWTEGQQFSKSELKHLLTKACFRKIKTMPTLGNWTLTVGYK